MVIKVLIVAPISLLPGHACDETVGQLLHLLLPNLSVMLLEFEALGPPEEVADAETEDHGGHDDHQACEDVVDLLIMLVAVGAASLNLKEDIFSSF